MDMASPPELTMVILISEKLYPSISEPNGTKAVQ